jgi:hypothetical protein
MRVTVPVRIGALPDRGPANEANPLGRLRPSWRATASWSGWGLGPKRRLLVAALGHPCGACARSRDHRCVSCGGLARSRHRRYAPNVTAFLERQLRHVVEIAGQPDTGAVITGTDP